MASFSIIANLIMMVTEKAREVAILKSMGARDGAILRIFFAEGLYIGLLGLVLGVGAGVAGCLLLAQLRAAAADPDVYYIEKMPVVMRAGEIAAVGLAALACAAWPPSTRRSWHPGCGRSTACGTSERDRVPVRHARPSARQPGLTLPESQGFRGSWRR